MAVLVAVSIPIFTTQLEKAREATDEANLRSLYAETVAAVLIEDEDATTTLKDATLDVAKDDDGVVTGTATLKLSQQRDGLEGNDDDTINIGGVDVTGWGPGKTATIVISSSDDPSITIE